MSQDLFCSPQLPIKSEIFKGHLKHCQNPHSNILLNYVSRIHEKKKKFNIIQDNSIMLILITEEAVENSLFLLKSIDRMKKIVKFFYNFADNSLKRNILKVKRYQLPNKQSRGGGGRSAVAIVNGSSKQPRK